MSIKTLDFEQTSQGVILSLEVNQGIQGAPGAPGSDATVTNASVNAAMAENAAASRTAIGLTAGTAGLDVQEISALSVFSTALGGAIVTAGTFQVGDNILTQSADFTLSESTHGGKYMRLTKTGSTQTITLPTSEVSVGMEFYFFRATAQSLAFSGGTVAGAARLADVVENSGFALKCTGDGTYDFI